MAKSKGLVVALPTIVSKEMPERILEKIRIDGKSYLEKPISRFSGGNVSILGIGGGIELTPDPIPPKSFACQLSEMCSDMNRHGKPVLILVDEVRANSEALKQLIIAYQEMVGNGLDVFLVLAGLPMTISSVLNDHVLTFLNRASKLPLSPLRIRDIEMYYQNAFGQLALRLTEEMIHHAAAATSGSPYLMQLIGHYLTICADEAGVISKEQYDTAIDKAKEDFMNDICQTTLAPLSHQDISFLIAMAEDEDFSRISDVIDRLHCSSSFAQTYKRRLIHAGVIEQYRRGEIRFAVPYLKEYLVHLKKEESLF